MSALKYTHNNKLLNTEIKVLRDTRILLDVDSDNVPASHYWSVARRVTANDELAESEADGKGAVASDVQAFLRIREKTSRRHEI